ncbi:MAG: histidinol dehydrogenase [Actinobacteria bacterium]|nr:histidinol dehydrogenase [Actinomycetota bacterium]
MIQIVDLRGQDLSALPDIPRADVSVPDVLTQVEPIIADVAIRGAAAVRDWSQRLDGTSHEALRVAEQDLDEALAAIDPEVRDALSLAIERVRAVHADHLPTPTTTTVVPGGVVTQRWEPIERVGLYVPGGRAVYPSSVIMNVVPAQIAGVASIAVVSPPQPDNGGLPSPLVLAACRLLGVDEVYAVGGAQAVAMLAYGLDDPGITVPPVDLITGPGNVYVTAAKRLVLGRVGIDAEAGPTEIMILADETADARHVAADLISQAEHDTLAASVLVTPSVELIPAVVAELEEQVARTKHDERIRAALAGHQSGIYLVDDLEVALKLANRYGAEHLEVHTQDSRGLAARITNAGAVFVGAWSPVSLGDYAAGSNHVLPTGGTSAHSSGLGVVTFLRRIQVIEYDDAALAGISTAVQTLAAAEDLPAHAAAMRARDV